MKYRLLKIFTKDQYKGMGDLIAQIKSVREVSDIIAFTPAATGSCWKGVGVAGKNLFGSRLVELPQYYSQSLLHSDQLEELAWVLKSCQFKQLIFNGFLPYMEKLMINEAEVSVGVVFHGALSELMDNAVSRECFEMVEQLAKQKKIHKLGFVKKGLAETFSQLWEIDCYELPLPTKTKDIKVSTLPGLNIGVFGYHNFNKNVINQVYAALLIPNAKVHVLGYSDVFDKINKERLVIHPNGLPQKEFLCLLGAMDLNLHLSFSESWGQIVTESLAMGVPCLSSHNNGIFDYDDFLADKLLVSQNDNPVAIAEKIKAVLKEREVLAVKGNTYSKQLNKVTEEKINNFLQNDR